MAVADVEKAEKVEKPAKSEDKGATGVAAVAGWLPRKLAETREFLSEVRSELRKVTWPGRQEVYSTTLVVIATSIFFGFYLWGLDLVMSRVLSFALTR